MGRAAAGAATSVRLRVALLVVAAVLGSGWGAAEPAASHAAAPAAAAAPLKSCSSGWTHGVIGGVHKCLRAGQFCARRHERDYHRYGFHCHRFDTSAARYRLS